MASVEQRLAEIERTQERVVVLLESLTQQVSGQQAAEREWRTRLDGLLNGDAANPGLRLRLDRLEQDSARARWVLRTLGAAVLALVLKAGHSLLNR
jgi:Tfp pilus assembly protein PilN